MVMISPSIHIGRTALSGGGAAVIPWYLKGGVAKANCVAAYSPEGAASLADSYINLVNPGTYDLTLGTAPAWDAVNGWQFDGVVSNRHLKTGIVPVVTAQAWSAIVKSSGISGSSNNYIFGMNDTPLTPDARFFIYNRPDTPTMAFANGDTAKAQTIAETGGLFAFLGTKFYFNNAHVFDAAGGVGGAGSIRDIWIGCLNNGALSSPLVGNIQKIAFYNTTLTEAQYLAILAAAIDLDGGFDVFIIAGQSNASGRGTNPQTFTKTGAFDSQILANDYFPKTMADPSDDNTNQIDAVSSDAAAAGSCWPLLATTASANSRKTLFVPCSYGGSAISDWAPGADHQDRTTLYGSLVYRATLAEYYGTLRGVVFYGGEADALAGTSQAAFNAGLDTFANAIQSDLGIPVLTAKIHDSSDRDETNVNAAIAEAISDNANVLLGANMSGYTPDGDVHFTSDQDLTDLAAAWWTALQAAFGW